MQSPLLVLRQLLERRNYHSRAKLNPIPRHSLISQLLVSLREFSHNVTGMWAEHLSKNKKANALALLIDSWQLYLGSSLECQLLSTLLCSSDSRKIQLFLRLRKYVGQLMSSNSLDEIMLRHQDSIVIVHRMFPTAIRKEIANGLKQIFIAFKATEAKINACVLIEFILSIYDSTGEEEQSLMAGQTRITSHVQLSDFSSIVQYNSNLQKQNIFKKHHFEGYSIIQTKFLPKELEKKESNFVREEKSNNQSQQFSNTLSFTEEQAQQYQQELKKERQKIMNRFSNKENVGMLFFRERSSASEKQILIEDSSHIDSSLSIIEDSNVPLQLKQVVMKNRQFKERMLSLNGEEGELTQKEQMGIRKTINVIHNSVVRNHQFR